MMYFRIMILIVGLLPLMGAAPSIEIVAKGKSYPSLKAYQQAKLTALQEEIKLKKNLGGAKMELISPTSDEKEEMVKEAKVLGITTDPGKIKTVVIKPRIVPATGNALKGIGAQEPVKQAIDYFENKDGKAEIISIDELGDKIQKAVGDRKEPVLVVSDKGRMSVMALNPPKGE